MSDEIPFDGTLPAVPGGWKQETVELPGQNILLTSPADPDAFLDDPAALSAHSEREETPYWPYLWPTARRMAAEVLQADWPFDADILELGAGIGLVGLAASARGWQVTFSDNQADAVTLALYNAWQNGWGEKAAGLLLDWYAPEDQQFSVILGCEVTYQRENHAALLDVVERMLAPNGIAWFGEPGRIHAPKFIELAQSRGFVVRLFGEGGVEYSEAEHNRFQIIALTRPE